MSSCGGQRTARAFIATATRMDVERGKVNRRPLLEQ